ncbi:deazaflavin-dependent oxidoreductase, nitroreductase family [Bellilinea caldifistulae]|uniref:nitroreductase family deazaflavin-dependent oxidoreductase n=1 Tax=Bellilinea caldifistulae TaxID=360411 RepID=UPI0007855914|nr:nitroreductase family deazaflavin-dependent oxidoreductase [Bellilinea caldifistulae]GAP11960.1 deazaflavin-dependent oxidoreductase, nitroreductase family [Bellilinea caldifistulae]
MKEPISAEMAHRLRGYFKKGNLLMVWLWRLGLGKHINAAPKYAGQVMVLEHSGRKSGKRYRTPVNYAIVNGEIYCVAGFGQVSDWYRNIIVNPQVEVWLPDGWWAGIAEEVLDADVRLPIMRQVLIASGFAARLFGVDPIKLNDEELERLTRDYRLIRIRRTVARTGEGGPGDLAWVWPLTTFFLLFLLLKRRPRKG